MILANATLMAINDALERDQGAAFRQNLRRFLPLIEDAYRGQDATPRGYFGASSIGHECARALWYNFHWVKQPQFDGKTLRLFNRGHLEEGRILALLAMVGIEIHHIDERGRQYGFVGYRGHLRGSGDGVIRGVLECPEDYLLLEGKTHGDKSFNTLKQGVTQSHPMHYRQMQSYMGHLQLKGALYVGVNKNTDALHLELVEFDAATFERYEDRAKRIIDARHVPVRINDSPGWYQCRLCDYYGMCHGDMPIQQTCRMCSWVSLEDDGIWRCTNPSGRFGNLDKAAQWAACPAYDPLEHK